MSEGTLVTCRFLFCAVDVRVFTSVEVCVTVTTTLGSVRCRKAMYLGEHRSLEASTYVGKVEITTVSGTVVLVRTVAVAVTAVLYRREHTMLRQPDTRGIEYYTIAGVTVVRKYDEQSAVPCLVVNAEALIAMKVSLEPIVYLLTYL